MNAENRHRIRHGITFDPLFGYRAIREIDGHREYLGPWVADEGAAQATADHAAEAVHAALASVGAAVADRPTTGLWAAREP